jgi:hypothetical protein
MNGYYIYPLYKGQKWCEQCDLPLDICRGHDTVNQMIAGIADVARLKSFVTPDKETRYSESDRSSYDTWSFQVQLAGFLNKCLDHPIVDDEPISASEAQPATNTMRAPAVDVTALAQQIAALPAQTLTELAAAMAAIDAPMAERFGDMLLDAVYDATVVEFRPPFFVEPAADLNKWAALDDDIDYDYLPAMAQ